MTTSSSASTPAEVSAITCGSALSPENSTRSTGWEVTARNPTASRPTARPAPTQQRHRGDPGRPPGQPPGRPAGARRHHGGHHRHQQAPGHVLEADGRVVGQRRQRQDGLGDPRPVVDAGEHQRGRPRGQEPGQQHRAEGGRGDHAAARHQLEQQQRRRQRPPEHRADGRERPSDDQDLAARGPRPQRPGRDQPGGQAKGGQRRLRAEDQPKPEGGECGQQGADQLDRRQRLQRDPFDRWLPAVAGQPQGHRHQQPGHGRDGQHVPARAGSSIRRCRGRWSTPAWSARGLRSRRRPRPARPAPPAAPRRPGSGGTPRAMVLGRPRRRGCRLFVGLVARRRPGSMAVGSWCPSGGLDRWQETTTAPVAHHPFWMMLPWPPHGTMRATTPSQPTKETSHGCDVDAGDGHRPPAESHHRLAVVGDRDRGPARLVRVLADAADLGPPGHGRGHWPP